MSTEVDTCPLRTEWIHAFWLVATSPRTKQTTPPRSGSFQVSMKHTGGRSLYCLCLCFYLSCVLRTSLSATQGGRLSLAILSYINFCVFKSAEVHLNHTTILIGLITLYANMVRPSLHQLAHSGKWPNLWSRVTFPAWGSKLEEILLYVG